MLFRSAQKGIIDVHAIWDSGGGVTLANLKTSISDVVDASTAFTVSVALASSALEITVDAVSGTRTYFSQIINLTHT